LVDPGEYTVAIAAVGKTESKTVAVEEDPRVTMSAEDRAKRRQALTKLYGLTREADGGRRKIVALQTSLTTLTDGWKRPNTPKVPDDVKKAADALLAKVGELAVSREINSVKARLQRMNPVEEQAGYNRMFGDLVGLEKRRKALLDRAAGA